MQWSKAIIAGVVGGIVTSIYNFIMYGMIMSGTYAKYTIFRGEADAANPAWYSIIAILIGVVGGVIFAKTRPAWGAGVKGGVTFGFWISLIGFLANFYMPLTIAGFPYYLTWCEGGIMVIGWMVFGAVVGAMYKG
jgi:hypothetical protein